MTTNNPVVVASCDSIYFKKYAIPFVLSAVEHDLDLVINIVNADAETMDVIQNLSYPSVRYMFEVVDVANMSEEQWRVYLTAARFRVAAVVVKETNQPAMVLDIDSAFLRPLRSGLFAYSTMVWDRREEQLGSTDVEKRGMKVLACAYSGSSEFFRDVWDYVNQRKFSHWFLDQEALYYVWSQSPFFNIKEASLKTITPKLLDWDFEDDSYIWYPKGPRKATSAKWKNLVEKYRLKYENQNHIT